MHRFLLGRFVPIIGALIAMTATAAAQADPEKPVTPPNSYRVVMENDRVRIIEVHIKARSKVEVETPPGRDRFLYMLSDGALILAQPGKTPYEFALNAGETAVFPAVTPYVENDTDARPRPDGGGQIRRRQPSRGRRRQAEGQICREARLGQDGGPTGQPVEIHDAIEGCQIRHATRKASCARACEAAGRGFDRCEAPAQSQQSGGATGPEGDWPEPQSR
jgi:hypothetical protein